MSSLPHRDGDTPRSRLRAGDLLELVLESWGRLGEAMGRHCGELVFVLGGIPGERVRAEIVRVHRKYASATVAEVLEASPPQD